MTPPKKCDNQFRLAIVLIIIRIRQTSVPYFHFHCVSMLCPVVAINQPFHFPHKVNNAMEEVRVLINNNSLHLHRCCFFAWCNSPKFLTVALSSMKSNNPPETACNKTNWAKLPPLSTARLIALVLLLPCIVYWEIESAKLGIRWALNYILSHIISYSL